MELEKFIIESLSQIHSALKQVNEKLTENYTSAQKKNIFLLKPGSIKREGEGIHFDLAITSKTEKTTKGKIRARIFVVEGILDKDHAKRNEQVSRISFTVNVTKWAGTYKKPPPNK